MNPRIKQHKSEELVDTEPVKTPALPFDYDFQRKIVSVMAHDPDFIRRNRTILESHWFGAREHQDISRVILDSFDKYGVPPSREVLIEATRASLSGTRASVALGEIDEVSATEADPAVGALVLDFVRDTRVKRVLDRMDEMREQKRFGDIATELSEALAITSGGTSVSGVSFFDTTEERLARRTNKTVDASRFVKTYIPPLDALLKGGRGMPRGSVLLVAAPPNTGKTTSMISMAGSQIMMGKFCLFFPMEETREDVEERMDSRLFGMDQNDICGNPKLYLRKVVEVIESKGGDMDIFEYPPKAMTPNMLREHIKESQRKRQVDVVFLDYMKLMRPDGKMKFSEPWQMYEDVCINVKRVARETGVLIVSGWQTGADTAGKRVIEVADFKDTKKVVDHVDVGLTFCQTKEELDELAFRFYIARSRYGQKHAEILMGVDYSRSRIKCA